MTEIKDFNILAESIFGKNVTLGNVKIIGVRDNKYSTSVGMIKNFNNKLNLKDRDYSIFDSEEIELSFNGEIKPIILNYVDNDDLTQLILPIRTY